MGNIAEPNTSPEQKEPAYRRLDHSAQIEKDCFSPVLLDKRTLAKELSLCPRTIDALMAKGLPFIRLSPRCIRFPRAAVLQWLASRTIGLS